MRHTKIIGVPLIAAAALVIGGCGGGSNKTPATTSKAHVPLSSAPSYNSAKQVCRGSSPEALARSLGVSTTNPARLAKKYAQLKSPPALREGTYEGCYAGLTK